MNEEARRRIAFAAAQAAGAKGSAVFSYSSGEHTSMSGSGGAYFDYGSGSHFTDSFDYESGSHWSIEVKEKNFSGFHYGSGDHFSGTVDNGSVRLFDYGEGAWHSYQV